MAGYNLTAYGEANTIYGMFSAANDAVGGLFGGLALVSIFIVFLTMSLTRQNPPAESFFFASLVGGVTSLIFLWLELAPEYYVIGFSVLFALSGIGLYRSKGS